MDPLEHLKPHGDVDQWDPTITVGATFLESMLLNITQVDVEFGEQQLASRETSTATKLL